MFEPYLKQMLKFLPRPTYMVDREQNKNWLLSSYTFGPFFLVWYLFWWSRTSSCILSFEKFKVVKCINKKQIIIEIQWISSWYTFSWCRWLTKSVWKKKQSQTNHINNNPSLNKKKKKNTGISSAILRMEDSFCFEECVHKESGGHDFVFSVFLDDFVSYPQVFHMCPLCPWLKNP